MEMNTILFVTSHLGAEHNQLVSALNRHSRILIHNVQGTYQHISDIELLIAAGHKRPGVAAIYGDQLLYNHQFCCKPLLGWCRFVYLIQNAKCSLNTILAEKNCPYTPLRAFRYYAYRLRRICEMAKRTPGAVMLRWRDVVEGKGESLIADYLKIKGVALDVESADVSSADSVPYEILRKAEDCYERHLYYLKSLQVRRAF